MYPHTSPCRVAEDQPSRPRTSLRVPDCSWGEGYVMGFGFRVGVPGMSVRVSTRGVRTSVGPRAARLSVGSGGARMSTGLGPFYASTSLGGNRRRTSTRRTTRSRTIAPSAAQLDRARRQAERAQQEAERDAAIAQLRELRRQMTSVHLESFPAAHPPVIPDAPRLSLSWALAEARTFHLQGVGRLARAERAAARQRAEQDAPAYLAAETARLGAIRHQLTGEPNTGGKPCSPMTRTPSAKR